MGLITGRDAKMFIGPASEADTLTEFQALTGWVEIKDIVRIGPRGATSNVVTQTVISENTTRKAKGVRNNGNAQLTCAINTQDPGQQALRAAEATNNKYAFKVSPRDRPNPTGTDSIQFFNAIVTSAEDSELANDTAVTIVFGVEIDGDIFRVEAATGS